MYNKAIVIGRLTKAPELKQTNSGKSVCGFSIAVDRRFDREKTDFLSIVAWGKTAEFVCNYFHKGDAIGIDGHIETRSYEKDGVRRTATEIIAEAAFFVGGKNSNSNTENAVQCETSQFEQIEDEHDLPF